MSFWELVVVGIVALLGLGPEKLPGAIRTVTGTIRSIRQFGNQMKSELADELRVHELHEKLRQAEEKGLLGLSADEIQALAQLRNAAAEVNDPYGFAGQDQHTQPTAALSAPSTTPANATQVAAPVGAVLPAPVPIAPQPTSQPATQPAPPAAGISGNGQPSNVEHHEHNVTPRP